jgi:pimeloyl-ACP methyl ester carboxylesterase
MDSVVEIARALKLDRPVYMGCSVGGYLAPDLALYRPEDFRAVIGINAGPGAPPRPDAPDEVTRPNMNWHPRISNGSTQARYTYHYSMFPTSPEPYRRETGWVYSQGGPGVFAGDLYYFSRDHDLTNGKARQIDTSKIGVYLLNGESDNTVTSHSLEDLLAQIPGCVHQVMKGGSHFAMCEDYPLFRQYLLPVLEQVYAKHGKAT